MSVNGQITYCLRNAVTLEVEEEYVVNNIVTDAFYDQLTTDLWPTYRSIVITSAELAPSRYLTALHSNVAPIVSVLPDGAIPSVAQAVLYPAVGSVQPFIQFSGRYNAPAAQRTIKTIALVQKSTTQSYLNNVNTGIVPMAYAKLNTACIQTTSQVLDIYYRLFFTIDSTRSSAAANELLQQIFNDTNNSNVFNLSTIYPTPIVKKLKSGDEMLATTGMIAHHYGFGVAAGIQPTVVLNSAGKYMDMQWSMALTDWTGIVFSAYMTGGRGLDYSPSVNALDTNIMQPTAFNATNLTGFSKIQNLIGHGTTVKPLTATPWLDVDNLPSGTGKATLSGTWNNLNAPIATGLYSKALLPQLNTIQITTVGQVGVAAYKFTKRNFFGNRNVVVYNVGYPLSTVTQSAYTFNALPSMCGTGPVVNGSAGIWRQWTADAGKSLIEDITTNYLDTRQISASCRYDDGSFIFVKKNKIILYSVGAGDYWKFNGPYTDIHQVAVVAGVIYVACRNTGLYAIDPINSLNVVSLSAPAAGIDLSNCFGVAEGYGNSVWAVGVNGLMRFQSGVWTKYDSTTTPSFTMVGVSDGKWSNIDYLKVDVYSTTFQMMLVRRITADVNPTLFGIWWSTATAAANSFADILTAGIGRPRVNRSHFGGSDGLWAIANISHKVTTFGNNTLISVIGGAAFSATKAAEIWSSIFFVKNDLGQTRLMVCHELNAPVQNSIYSSIVRLVNSAGVITDTVQSGMAEALEQTGGWYQGIFGAPLTHARSSVENAYGKNDCCTSFIMAKGAMITLWCGTENKALDFSGAVISGSTVDILLSAISNYAMSQGLDGGTLAYLAQTTYGWTGTAWSETSTASKPTHNTPAELSDGVLVKFDDGAAGASFVTPNYYTYGVCEGLMKDNATRALLKTSFFFRKRQVDSTVLSAYVVPGLIALPTGLVGLDTNRSSSGALMNASNQVYFPSEGGAQYGIGDKQVTGDFEISYNVSALTTAPQNSSTLFGVSKYGLSGARPFGFKMNSGAIYTNTGMNYALQITEFSNNLSMALSSITSMGIKRVGGVMTALINGIVKATNIPATSGIRLGDSRLDLASVQDWSTVGTYMIANRSCPATTIVSNGSDSMVYVGSAADKSGAFGPRWNGVDTSVTNYVSLDGVPYIVKYTGTAPLVGEVAIDADSGAIYFNAADVGKTISAKITYTCNE